MTTGVTTPSQAYWNQRQAIVEAKERLLALSAAIDKPGDLLPHQWAQLYAMTLEFKPDLVLELGRGHGNSTCAFTEAANRLGGVSVLSLDTDPLWSSKLARLRQVVPEAWFGPLRAPLADILSFDYATAFASAKRVLVFWDAHGYDVAECVLGGILPLLQAKEHLVVMHDLSDARYMAPQAATGYGPAMYKGGNAGEPKLRLGHVISGVEQAIAITDFAARNGLELHSADHDLHTNLAHRSAEMHGLMGEMFSLQAHWFYFSLSGLHTLHTLHFPPFHPPARPAGLAAALRRLFS